MSHPRYKYWVTGKNILRYLRSTIAYGLKYASNGVVLLLVYIDYDWGGSIVDQKSTSRYCFSLGSAMISWSSRKQGSVSQRTIEAEYIDASTTCREAIWLRKLLGGLLGVNIEPTVIRCDNQSYIKIFENPVFPDKSKHIEMKYHFIRNMVQKGMVKLQYVSTKEQIADVMTKPLSVMKFRNFQDNLGMEKNVSLTEREC